MEWDATLGVWKGSKAATDISSNIPNPLYIFGYGSLLWRPGDLLSKYPAYPCVCYGWRRLFAQRSMDHRGTTQFPGYVATLVSDQFFENQEHIVSAFHHSNSEPSECVGLVFLVPDEDIEELIAELDFREKGGYHRHVISVKLLQKTRFHDQNELANALVYTGPTDNPNFSLNLALVNWEIYVSRIIAVSVGPSGENAEYLLQLASFVGQQLQHDHYLAHLSDVVFQTMCSWRGRLLLQRCNQIADEQFNFLQNIVSHDEIEISKPAEEGESLGPHLVGWGSNESYQLTGIESFKYHFQSSPVAGDVGGQCPEHLIMTPAHLGSFKSLIPNCIVNKNELYNPQIFHYQVYAGGSRSAVQCHTHLYIWGDISSSSKSQTTRSNHKCWRKSFYLSDSSSIMVCQEEIFLQSTIVPSTAHRLSSSYDVLTFSGVESVAMGHHHNLLLSHDRTSVIAFGNDEHGQCSDNSSFLLPPLSALPSTKLTVLKLSTGLEHSALVTTTGIVYTWGDTLHGQCLPENLNSWSAPKITLNEERYCGVIPRVIDVACGAYHTILIDTIGRIYSFGSNRYGQLGRDVSLSLVGSECDIKKKRPRVTSNIPSEIEWKISSFDGVKWNKISCGWSHNILQGVTALGEIIFAGWGRCDMGQLPIPGREGVSIDQEKSINYPYLISTPSQCGRPFVEIWCGSEYTLALTESGDFWSRGWREHGNLGHDPADFPELSSSHVCHQWIPLKRGVSSQKIPSYSLNLKTSWTGKVACGGAHCIALVDVQS